MKKVRIEDVAERAGVSLSTVSRVINNTGNVHNETAKKVLIAAQEVGYKLTKRKDVNYNIAILSISTKFMNIQIDPFLTNIIRGIQDVLTKRKSTHLQWYNSLDENFDILKYVKTNRLKGLILSGITTKGEYIDILKENDVPFVLINPPSADNYLNYVEADIVDSFYDATNYLIKEGHSRIGILSGPKIFKSAFDEIKGYKKALAENNIKFNKDLLLYSEKGFTMESGYYGMEELLKKDITAIIACGQLLGRGVLKKIKEKNIKLNKDIKVIVIDDTDGMPLIEEKLDYIKVPAYEMGVEAVNLLFRVVENVLIKGSHIILKSEFIKVK